MQRPLKEKNAYYPDPVIFGRQKLIFMRFDQIAQNQSASSTPIYFPNDDIFNDKIITGIEMFKPNTGPVYTLVTDYGTVDYIGSFLRYTLTLVGKDNRKIIDQMPVNAFSREFTFGKVKRLSCEISLSKSYVLLNQWNVSIQPNTMLPFNFHYVNKVQS